MPFDPEAPDGPDDWFVPGNARTDPYPNDWFVPSPAAPNAANAGPSNPPAAPIANPAVPPPDPLAAYWSRIPASRVGTLAWDPPNLPLFAPSSATNFPAPTSPFAPPIPPGSWPPTSSADNSPPPEWASGHSLLGGIASLLAPSPAAAGGGLLGQLATLGMPPPTIPRGGLLGALATLGTPPPATPTWPQGGPLGGLSWLGSSSPAVQGPGGATIDFPDGTDAATIHNVMPQHFGGAQESTWDYIKNRFNNPPAEPSLIGLAGGIWHALGLANDIGAGKIDLSTLEGADNGAEATAALMPFVTRSPAIGTGRAIARLARPVLPAAPDAPMISAAELGRIEAANRPALPPPSGLAERLPVPETGEAATGTAPTSSEAGGPAATSEQPSPTAQPPLSDAGKPGSFSIFDWPGYAGYVPRPKGPFRMLEGQEYDEARTAADRINEKLHDLDPETYKGKHIHEIHPIKFGGSPTDLTNKIALWPKDHYALNVWWGRFQRNVETGKVMPGKDK